MDPSQDFKSLQDKIQGALVATTKSVNRVASEDLAFQRTANASTGDRLDSQLSRLLNISNALFESASKATGQKPPRKLEDAEDVDISWRGAVDAIDGLLEKADTCLDEYTGLIKRKVDSPTLSEGPKAKKSKSGEHLEWNMRRANVAKPQNAFEIKPDNFSAGPWRPILTTKPHAIVPLEQSLGILTDERKREQYKHPYETEILQLKYPASTYEKRDPIMYQPVDKTSAIWVDTWDGVLEMLEELKQAKEIAVDLEHHDYRTYTGLLSLMQISTRQKDWVVDTLTPWRHRLEILNEVFADPSILKVFHGAFMDIVWLQRDLGLYVVGMFDTFHASSALNYTGRGLVHLLAKFTDFQADKKYQMADWRIRPLTKEMLYYARCDTHFLLYVYDRIRNELVDASDRNDPEKDLIEWALQKSKGTSLERYEGNDFNPETGVGPRGWFNWLTKNHSVFNGEQFAVFKILHAWRDNLARKHDESTGYIMPQSILVDIAKCLPEDARALWGLLGHSSPEVRHAFENLFAEIQKARAAGANGPTSVEFLSGESAAAVAKREVRKKSQRKGPDVPGAKDLRTKSSQLWGSVPLSSKWDGSSKQPGGSGKEEQISLPWTTFVQDAIAQAAQAPTIEKFKTRDDEVDMISLESAKKPASAPPKQAESDDVEFTLRQGHKRKIDESGKEEENADSDAEEGEVEERSAVQSGLDTEEIISLNVKEAKEHGKSLTKEQRKAAKKARMEARMEAKRLKKNSHAQGKEAANSAGHGDGDESPGEDGDESPGEDGDEEQPFDYSKAQSVLHAQRAANGAESAFGQKKVLDPYAAKLTAEGPKPARRMHFERGGKTATFKK